MNDDCERFIFFCSKSKKFTFSTLNFDTKLFESKENKNRLETIIRSNTNFSCSRDIDFQNNVDKKVKRSRSICAKSVENANVENAIIANVENAKNTNANSMN